jgi:hypothetical protein
MLRSLTVVINAGPADILARVLHFLQHFLQMRISDKIFLNIMVIWRAFSVSMKKHHLLSLVPDGISRFGGMKRTSAGADQ